jgi:creatinine amidohydrolase
MAKPFWWTEFSAPDFADIDPMRTIAILPIAALEQHGPHLPVGTDAILNGGCLEMLRPQIPEGMDVRVLPIQQIGKSNEHIWAPGTATFTAGTLIEAWVEIGLSVARAGIRKLVLVNSHGGNEEVMGIVARELRVRAGLLAVKSGWMRFGMPDGLVPDLERRHGIHGGDVETSLMLHFRPELVDMSRAENFRSIAARDEEDYALLRPTGTHAYAWIASDLNPSGAVGDAASATAEKGRIIAEHQVRGMLDLLREVEHFPLPSGLTERPVAIQ